jgi:hypothetical protein
VGNFVSPAQTFEADRLKYPGMLLREILVWKTWQFGNASRFDRFEYNVRLGDGVDPGPSYQDSARRQWILNSMKRADVIAVKGSRVTIIEVEDNPGLSAIGQVVGYEALWVARVRRGGPPDWQIAVGVEDFFPTDLPLDPDPDTLLVVARAGNDLLTVAQRSGVKVEVVQTDFSPLKPGAK